MTEGVGLPASLVLYYRNRYLYQESTLRGSIYRRKENLSKEVYTSTKQVSDYLRYKDISIIFI